MNEAMRNKVVNKCWELSNLSISFKDKKMDLDDIGLVMIK